MAYTAVTLADLKVGMTERWDSAVFWTDEEARLAINEALRDWNLLVGRWTGSVTLVAGAGTVEYATGVTLLYNTRVKIGASPSLIVASKREIDLMRTTWRSETTAAGGDVPTAPVHWIPISLQRLAIWPQTAGAGASIVVTGVAATPVLVEDADTVDLGQELHDDLLDYALHVAAFKEGGDRWRATLPYMTEFLKSAAEENSLLKTSRFYRRFAGLDRTKDLRPTTGVPTSIDALPEQVPK